MYVEAIASGGGSDWFYVVVVHAPNGADIHVDDGDEDIDVTVASGNYVGIPVHNENSTYTITAKMNGITAPAQTFTTGSTSGQMTEKTFEFAEIQLDYDDEFRGQTITFTDGTHSPSPAITLPGAPDNNISIFVPCDYAGNWSMECVDPVSGDTFPSAPNPIPVPGTPGIVQVHLFVIPDGKTVTPTDVIETWLLCANIKEKTYTTLDEVLDDPETLIKLMASDNAVDYMVRSKTWIDTVPIMTSDTTPSGNNVYASSRYDTSGAYDPYWALSDNPSHPWSDSATSGIAWLCYKGTTPKIIDKVRITYGSANSSRTFSAFSIQGSNDTTNGSDGTWTDVTPTNLSTRAVSSGYDDFEVDTQGVAYTAYRIYITARSGNATIYDIKFHCKNVQNNELAMEAIGQNDYAASEVLDDSDWKNATINSEYADLVCNVNVPAMTDNTHPSGTASDGGHYSSYDAFQAFDRNESTYWYVTSYLGKLYYEFPKEVNVFMAEVLFETLSAQTYNTIELKGSNDDGATWTPLGTVANPHTSDYGTHKEIVEFTGNTTKYKKYGLFGTGTSGNYGAHIKELQFYGREAGGVLSWLNAAGISKCYLTLEEVISDRETLQALMMSHDAVDYLVTAKSFIDAITSSKEAMMCIGNSNYASDTLLGDSEWFNGIGSSVYSDSVFTNVVPAMTDNTHPSGTCFAIANRTGSSDSYYAFDDDIEKVWQAGATTPVNSYIGYMFDSPIDIKCARINRGPFNYQVAKEYGIEGSNDTTNGTDGTWVPLTPTNLAVADSPYDWSSCAVDTSGVAYKAYRMHIYHVSYAGGTDQGAGNAAEIQFCVRNNVDETKIEIYSAANDQVYYMASGSPSILGTTDANGHLTINRSALPEGTITIYSNVAKDPNNLSNAFSKTFEITADTRALWVMPENTLYWYGYRGTFEVPTPGNGWGAIPGIASYANSTPTFNQQDLDVYNASYGTGIASPKPVSVGALQVITKTITGSHDRKMGGYNTKTKGVTPTDIMSFYSFVTSTDDNSYRIAKNPHDISGYPYLNAQSAGEHLGVRGFWTSRHNRIANFFSAAKDTVYYMSGGVQVVFAETDEFGEAHVDYTKLTPGTYDLYSSVADDPNNIGTAFYHKQVTINPNISKIYLMPDNALYWYGYQNPEYFANVVRNRITFNVNDLYQVNDTRPEVGFMTDYPFIPGVVSRINVIEEYHNISSYTAAAMMYNALPSGTSSMSGNRTSIGRNRSVSAEVKGLSYFDLTSASTTLYLGYYTEYTGVYNRIHAIWYE